QGSLVRRARDGDVEVSRRDEIAELLREHPVARELAADHRVDAGRSAPLGLRAVVHDTVVTRQRVFGGPVVVQGRADAGVRSDRARLAMPGNTFATPCTR